MNENTPLEKVHAALRAHDIKQGNKDERWTCPVCDKKDQLSVQLASDGSKVIVHCFRKCRTIDILDAVGLKMSDLYDNSFYNGEQFQRMLRDEYEWTKRDEAYFEGKVAEQVLNMRVRDEAKNQFAEFYGPQSEPIEFMSLNDLDDSPVNYRIQNLMPMGSNIILSAPAKAGKTTFILDLVRAMTTHDDFLGSVSCSKTAGTVVYVNMELDERMLRAYALQNGLQLGNKSLKIVNLRGKASSLNFMSQAFRESFTQQLIDQDCEVLIIDPLAPILAVQGMDSDNNDQVRQVLEYVNEVNVNAGLENLVIVDHTGHDSKGRPRGASAKLDTPDVLWNIHADGNMRTLKAFGRGVDNSVTFTRNESGRLVVAVGPDFDGDDRRRIIRELESHPEGLSTTALKDSLKLDKSILSERLRQLEDQGKITRTPGRGPRPDTWHLVSVEASTNP